MADKKQTTLTARELIRKAGGAREVSKTFDISVQAVSQWCLKNTIPQGRHLELARMARVSLKRVMTDLAPGRASS